MKRMCIYSKLKEWTKSFGDTDSLEQKWNLGKVGKGYARTSVNTSIFRKSSIISNNGVQFISFYDRKGRIVLGKRSLPDGKWILKKQPFQANIKDAHNIISLGIDESGYLHMAFGMHGAKLKYSRSVSPFSLDMQPLSGMDGLEETRVTYPEFHSLPNGDLLFVYRSGVSGNGNMVLKRYSAKQQNWKTIQLNLIDGEGERNAYWQMWIDNKGVFHVSWVWRETSDVASNHNLCYARSKDGGLTWEMSDGTPYSLPINVKNAETICEIPQNSELINQTSMSTDSEGNPYIATYWRDPDRLIPNYRVVWNNGTTWNKICVAERKTPFTLSGKGTKMVPISRPLILLKDKTVILVFRDEERGSKVSIAINLDLENGEWIFKDLTPFSVGAWEPTFDENLWNSKGILNLFVQTTCQGDGEKVFESAKKDSDIWIQDITPYLL